MPKAYRPIPPLTENQLAAFWMRVEKKGVDECWPWSGRTAKYDSRGVHSLPNGVFIVPRIIWALTKGIDPGTEDVLHKCDNPNCCNPEHLWLGSRGDNCRDRTAKGRTAQGEKHYLHLHPELRNGELNPAAKLTQQDVLEIREHIHLVKMGLLEQYNIAPSTLDAILGRRLWKHV